MSDDKKPINLAAFDLNLLTAFDALMREGQVSRAAEQVGRSQSAMSHMLGRLRHMFGDELFVRSKNGFTPTPKALELATIISPALASLRIALEGQVHFDPASSHRHFVVGMPDVASFVVMPQIMPQLRKQAPDVDLRIVDLAMADCIDALMSGQVELAYGYFPEVPELLKSQQVTTLDSVGLADPQNPYLRNGSMDMESFLAAPHVLTTFSSDAFGTDIDRHLKMHGAQRRIALQLPHYLSLPAAIRGTDLVATIERYVLPRIPDREGLVQFELPFKRPDTGVLAVWHPRHQHDPGHRWLRELIINSILQSE